MPEHAIICTQDRIIGKKVFKIRGLIPAANFIRVPRLKSQSLGLTGRFLYIQVNGVLVLTLKAACNQPLSTQIPRCSNLRKELKHERLGQIQA